MKYYIKVSIKDAKVAHELYRDGNWEHENVKQSSSSSYESDDEASIADFLKILTKDSGLEISNTNIDMNENATVGNVGGMGAVSLPSNGGVGSGDIPAGSKKIRKIKDILDDMKKKEDEEEDEVELTDEQKQILISILLNPDKINESELSKLDEGILGSIIGGTTGLVFGKTIGKLLADTLGIRENSPLYNVLTSRLVSTAIGAALGNKLNF